MKKKGKGSVTVVFSVVFVLLLSFVLSFFEMAAYTARSAYHASAALLAVENYFAGYLRPLYEQYHIFGREIPEGGDILSWTESAVAKDVLYMTQKREGEKSLLLRSGAAFSADSAKVLTENGLDGFYLQAVSAMKYRSVLELSDILKQFTGMAEQADTQLEIAVAKNETDTAYSLVEEKLLQLIEQVDGVSLSQYEKFLRGRTTAFQTEVYVKYFCTDPKTAAQYFDRTEVYQAFLKHSENPCAVLEGLAERTGGLLPLVKKREEEEEACQRRLKEIAEEGAAAAQTAEQLYIEVDAAKMQLLSVQAQIVTAAAQEEGTNPQLEALFAEETRISGEIEQMEEEKEALQKLQESLLTEKQKQEGRLGELNKQKREQDKQGKALSQEEDRFLKKCAGVAKSCEEAYGQTGEIRRELEAAKKVKAGCEKLLDSVQPVIGKEAAGEYRKELEKYKLYESAEGYDFEQMRDTLRHNAELLYNTGKCLSGTDAASLEAALTGLQKETEALRAYSFEGLKLNYGEMSLDEDLSGQAKDLLVSAMGKGFLGFLTEKAVSEKKLEVSYLPSGFRYEGNAPENVFSTLGTNVTAMLCELREMLPSGGADGSVLETAVNAVLFHSYLMTHFSDYLEENGDGALSYELEYLIGGKAADRDNLFSIAMQICVLRTALHFISLYTDGACKSAAEQAALAACGIIGLPALTSLIAFVLLFVWAAEEAIVDAAALLQGKKLALYPARNTGSLTFPEIFLFSQKLVLGKAKEKKEAGAAAFGYREYLQVYLLLLPRETKCYRALDLIQENLRKNYRDSFRVNRCVWKLSYQVDHRAYEYSYND